MMISRAQVNEVLRSYLERMESGRRSGARPSAGAGTGDRVRLSDDARRVAQWVKLAKVLPDGRADRVARVRDAISRGTYNPTSHDIAGKILERLITDRALEEQDA
ncbi:MAG TPA: flagellar biosynthesis anti-sigma factor FlgM [Bacillota bacterium]